jgi:GT2 family glycosyltransferase
MEQKVTAVVVTYQSAHTLNEMLAAARRCHEQHLLNCVFVDNGSCDATLDILYQEQGWATIVATGKNNGFARGCNIGLDMVHSPYTLFLNPDALVEPDTLRGMIEFLDTHPQVGIVGPATYYGGEGKPTTYQVTSDFPTPWSVVKAAIPLLAGDSQYTPIVPGSAPFQTGWVCGAVMMIRTELAKKLAGFDPRFFLYSEEIDLCRRAAQLGAQTWAVGTVTARHLGGASSEDTGTRKSGCIGKHYYQSRRYYMIKHHGWLVATLAEGGEFAMLCLGTLADVVRGRGVSRLRPRLQAPLFSQPQPF